MRKTIFFVLFFLIWLSLPLSSAWSLNSHTSAPIFYQAECNYPPIEFGKNGVLKGFAPELNHLIFRDSPYPITYSYDTWNKVYDRLVQGEVDIGGLMAITEDRKKEVLFSKPVLRTYISVYGKKDSKIFSLKELKKFKVGVEKEDYGETILKNNLEIKHYFAYSTFEEGIKALESGKIDFLFGNQDVINYLLVRNQPNTDIIPHLTNLFPMEMAFGVSRKRPELVEFIDNRLNIVQKSAAYEELFQSYFYRNSDYYQQNMQDRNIFLFFLAFIGIILIFILTRLTMNKLERKIENATAQLREEREWFRIVLASIGDGVIATDRQEKISFINPVALEMLELSQEQALGRPIEKIFQVFQEDKECYLLTKGGIRKDILYTLSPIFSEEGQEQGKVVVFQDIAERKKAEALIHYQAHYDLLTDLPNRFSFYKRLGEYLEASKRENSFGAVFFLDLDSFKKVNDNLGHYIGDILLEQTAQRLKNFQTQQTLVARLGGDEFGFIVTQAGEKEVVELAKQVLNVFVQPFPIDKYELFISASIGIALYPQHGQGIDILLKNADTAMYHAKELGKNNYQFYSLDLMNRDLKRLTLEKDLREAIDKAQFINYYQPRISVETGKIVGWEALIRWQHPKKGIILPGEFIQVAEEVGLISSVEEIVMRNACQQVKEWLAEGEDIISPVAVNISPCQFNRLDLTEKINDILDEMGILPKFLELEITESLAMKNINYTIDILYRLKDMGITLAIDDFGTGYSSLNYCRHFPIQFLKIDQSFIAEITLNSTTMSIVEAIIRVAHVLNLQVIAEGVETTAQLELLRKMKCDQIQGYLISPPVPPEKTGELIKRLQSFNQR